MKNLSLQKFESRYECVDLQFLLTREEDSRRKVFPDLCHALMFLDVDLQTNKQRCQLHTTHKLHGSVLENEKVIRMVCKCERSHARSCHSFGNLVLGNLHHQISLDNKYAHV